MAVRISTGLRNGLLSSNSFKGLFEAGSGFFLDIYTGSQPANADDAPTGTKLVTISNNSGGTTLAFEANATSGALPKSASQTWSGSATQSGTAGWFRLRRHDDTNVSSSSFVRYDGACATSGAQMNLGSLTITNGAPITVSSATFSMPASA